MAAVLRLVRDSGGGRILAEDVCASSSERVDLTERGRSSTKPHSATHLAECNHHELQCDPARSFRCVTCAADLSDWG